MTDFSLEGVLRQAEVAGMNEQLREAICYNYGISMGRYLDTHPVDSEPRLYRERAAMAWGYVAARQTIKAYRAMKEEVRS